jgi:Protein of unknown function (DUF2934)
MLGVTLSADEIEAAPPGVRRWLEQEIACTLGRVLAEPATHAAAPLSSDYNAEKAGEDAGGHIPTVEQRWATQGMVTTGSPEDRTRAEAIRNLVAARAYELWESQGRPDGRDLINWRQAEQEIMSCMGDGEDAVPSEEASPS